MKRKILSTFILIVISLGLVRAQEVKEQVTFRFVAGNDMFFSPWKGNGENLTRLTEFLNVHKEIFISGEVAIYINGYCSSVGTESNRLQRAKTMSNRVKSELITRCGLKEQNFITQNAATAFEGQKNIVLVNITIPQLKTEQVVEPAREQIKEEAKREPEHIIPKPELQSELQSESISVQPLATKTKGYINFNLRTNLLYWAAFTPNIGLEWRINSFYGIKIDGGYSKWEYNGKDKVQKLWFVNPEIRRYILPNKHLYIGLAGTFGAYNLKLGKTGYQGDVYGGGITAGYQLPMGKYFSWDFNVGLGAVHFTYDTFDVTDNVRVYREKNCSKTLFAPTQIGVNLIWHISHPSTLKK